MSEPQTADPDLLAALDTVMRDSLAPAAFAAGGLYLVVALIDLFALPAEHALALGLLALLTAVTFLGLGVRLVRRPCPAGWANPLAAAVALLALCHVLVHLWLEPHPGNTVHVALFIVAVGCFFLSLRWLLGIIAMALFGWGAIALQSPELLSGWLRLSYELMGAVAISVFMSLVRRNNYMRLLGLRREDARLRSQLEATIRVLREAQQFNQQMSNAAPFILYVCDVIERRAIYLNSRVGDVLGYSADEVQQLGPQFLVQLAHPDDRALQFNLWSRVRESRDGQVVEGEYRLRHADGSWRWISCREVVFNRDAVGSVDSVLGTVHDVTHQKRSEQILQSIAEGTASVGSTRYFSTLARYLASTLNVRHVLICAYLDVPATRVRTLAFWRGDRIHEDVEFELRGTPCEATARGEWTVFPQDLRTQFPSDPLLQELDAESYCGIPLLDSTGRQLGHLAILDDRPMETDLPSLRALQIFASRVASELERKHAEEALRASEERFRAVFESAAIGIGLLELDSSMRIVQANRALERMLGYGDGGVAGVSILDITHPDDLPDNLNLLDQLGNGKRRVFQFEKRFRHTNGHYVWVRVSSSMLRQPSDRKPLTLGLIEDISDRKQAEQQIRQLTLDLEHAARLSVMGEMAASVAHELNQPLAVIVNYAQGCARRLRKGTIDTDQLLDRLTKIADESMRAGEVIRGIRTFLQKREHDRRPVEINAIVREALQLARFDGDRHDVRIELVEEPSLPAVVADTIQITQVVLNLLLNALQAMESAGVAQPRLHIEIRSDGEFVEVSVSDLGPGIPPEAQQQIFEQFFTTKREGLGMGLAISRSIVESHGGRLWFTSKPGAGSTFRFTLPAVSVPTRNFDRAALLAP